MTDDHNEFRFNPWAPNAVHARTAAIAKATPWRQREVGKPGPVTIYKVDAAQVEQPKTQPPAMSTPPALLAGSEAAKERALRLRKNQFDFRVEHGTIGPRHDPYATTEVSATNRATGKSFARYSNGLGNERVTLYGMDHKTLREMEWIAVNGPQENSEHEAAQLCLQHVGVTPEEVEAWWNDLEHADPYGSPSRYE